MITWGSLATGLFILSIMVNEDVPAFFRVLMIIGILLVTGRLFI